MVSTKILSKSLDVEVEYMKNKIIYFLCTGNSCRSQMAEGWAKQYLGDEWKVYSAG